jgi:ABC-type lipoprotein release transport system permease subunit
MKIFIILGWRNIWRQKKRSLIVITSIAIGLFGMLFAAGFMNSMTKQMVDNTISTSLGHTAIHKKGFQDNMKLKYNFEYSEKIKESLKKNKYIKDFAPRVKIQGMVRSSEASRGVMIVGIIPDEEKKISKIYDYTIKDRDSRYLSANNPDSILISKSMGKKLDLIVGDRITVMIQDSQNEIVGKGLIIE